MFTDALHMMDLHHAHRPAAIGGFDGAAFRGALPRSQTCYPRRLQLARCSRAPKAKRQAWRVCATLTTERPSTADTVRPVCKAHTVAVLSLYLSEPSLAGDLVLRQSRFARTRLLTPQSRLAWGGEAAHHSAKHIA